MTQTHEPGQSSGPLPPPLPEEISGPTPTSSRRVIVISGGKGGVGKSLLTANLGIFLAQLGKRTLLFDADPESANLHAYVGIERPTTTLCDLLAGRTAQPEDCLVESPITGLSLVSAEGDLRALGSSRTTRRRLMDAVLGFDVDFLLIDLPPGIGPLALDLFLLSHTAVVVVTPEPSAIEGAYRLMKAAFLHRLRAARGHGPLPTPFDLLEAAQDQPGDPALAQRIEAEMPNLRTRLIVNQTRTRADLELGAQMRSAARRRLGLPVEYLGHLEYDDAVLGTVRKRHPLVIEHMEGKSAKNIERLARKLSADSAAGSATAGAALRRTEDQTLYEVLEIDPGASDEEIRRATRRMKETYAPDSLALSGLYAPDRVQAIQRRVEEAYDTLLDGERRRRYDLQLFPEGIPTDRRGRRPPSDSGELKPTTDPKVHAVTPDAAAALPLVPPPTITADTEFSGELLQRVRQALRLELKDIATRTKIGLAQLRAIEGEVWEALPAQVYLRGFLQEYAKCLRLDSGQVTRSYLDRYQRVRGEQATAETRRN